MLRRLGELTPVKQVNGDTAMHRSVRERSNARVGQRLGSPVVQRFLAPMEGLAAKGKWVRGSARCVDRQAPRSRRASWRVARSVILIVWFATAVLEDTQAQQTERRAGVDSVQPLRPLMIDEAQQRRLQRAEALAADARFDLAVPLWQKVLDDAGDQLVLQADTQLERYQKLTPVSSVIEATIAKLPPAGLREYRLSADAEARALLAGVADANREAALGDVVRTYFLSSFGDEAAFELACLKLERQQYYAALKLLEKLTTYPGSEISQGDVLLRLAVAQARVGDARRAQETLEQLASQRALVTARNLELVTQDTRQAVRQAVEVNGWPMPLGTPAHDGYMRRLPAKDGLRGYSEVRESRPQFPLLGVPELPPNVPKIYMSTKGQTKQMIYINGVIIDPDVYARERELVVNRHEIVERWKERGGRVVGDALFVDDLVMIDGGDRIVCYDRQTGEERWHGHPDPYDVDPLSKSSLLMNIADQRYGYRGQTSPYSTVAELQLFGDSIHHAMASSGGKLYVITGDGQPVKSSPAVEADEQLNWLQVQQEGIQRKRQNWLAAYDLGNGKLDWVRSAAANGETRTQAGFLCAPVAAGQRLVVPVSAEGKVWLYGLNASDGATMWRTFLGDEPVRTTIDAARASVAVDGGEAFVSAGSGAVVCVDIVSGGVQWGVRYTMKQASQERDEGAEVVPQQQRVASQDTVIVSGNFVIVIPSDFDHVFALQRGSGDILWQQSLEPGQDHPGRVEYCLGVHQNKLYMAGTHVVRAMDVVSGSIRWQQALQRSYGRGALTENALYVPDIGDVVQLSLDAGEVVSRTPGMTKSNEPVGNLYSDGRQLWVHGVGRIYVLEDLQQTLTELGSRIEKGDGEAHLQRSRIYSRLQKSDEAAADLQAGYAILSQELSPSKANQQLFDILDVAEFGKRNSGETLQWVVAAATLERQQAIADNPSRDRVIQAMFADKQLVATFDVEKLLTILPYCRTSALASVAEDALRQIVTLEDEPVLRTALQQPDPLTRRIVQAGLVVALRKAAKPRLLELLQSENENERLVGAAALAADAQREALPVLGDLLTSRDATIREKSIALLRQLTGKSFQYDAQASVYRRRRATTNWQAWINREGKTARLNTAQTKPTDSTKFTPLQVDELINGGQLIDAPK